LKNRLPLIGLLLLVFTCTLEFGVARGTAAETGLACAFIWFCVLLPALALMGGCWPEGEELRAFMASWLLLVMLLFTQGLDYRRHQGEIHQISTSTQARHNYDQVGMLMALGVTLFCLQRTLNAREGNDIPEYTAVIFAFAVFVGGELPLNHLTGFGDAQRGPWISQYSQHHLNTLDIALLNVP
jgi:hypothetical protein